MTQHLTTLDGVTLNNTWLTIGSFDGVHRGHQQLITELTEKAHQAGEKAVVLSFHPHPSVILRGRTGNFYLTTLTEKVEFLTRLGVDVAITHPFTYEVSQSSAREFIGYLKEHLGFSHLWVGEDFALGKDREGDVDFLKNHGREFHYQVHVIEPFRADGKVISSSLIRNLLAEGRVEEANILLGRLYRVMGTVVHGDGRGKSIGIPTANLDTGNEKLIPASGVYACRTLIANKIFPAAVNIGIRPTFQSTDTKAHVETHILDYSSDLYSRQIGIEFVARLRGEQRFASVIELIDQVNIDIEKTRVIISETINN
jgi:riboflavin kinase/FMN adenylyltransferase